MSMIGALAWIAGKVAGAVAGKAPGFIWQRLRARTHAGQAAEAERAAQRSAEDQCAMAAQMTRRIAASGGRRRVTL